MQLSLLALLAAGSLLQCVPAQAGGKTGVIHPIVVGALNQNKSLAFTPNDITASPGDILQFQFSLLNHTVTQSTFNAPCSPMTNGFNSGFVPVTEGAAETMTYSVPVNSTMPMYIYCAQGPHCQLGMVMTVNANGSANFAAYKAAASKAKANVPAQKLSGGVMGTLPSADAVPPPQ